MLTEVLSMLVRFALIFQYGILCTYTIEIFETHIRGLALGILIALGRILIAFSSFMMYFCDSYNLHPLSFCFVFALIAIPPGMLLPETKGKRLQN